MPDAWERVNGLWVGRRDTVSDAFFGAVQSEVEKLPPHVTAALSGGRVCVYAAREITDVHRHLNSGEGEAGAPMADSSSAYWRDKPRNAPDGLYWDHCWKEGRRWRPVAAVTERYWHEGEWRPWYRLGYVLRHELGHGFAQRSCGDRFGHSDPAFRSAYLDERRAALADPEAAAQLDYFLGHWSVGVAETFAESFAAALGPLDREDALFRSTFPRCLQHVANLLEAANA